MGVAAQKALGDPNSPLVTGDRVNRALKAALKAVVEGKQSDKQMDKLMTKARKAFVRQLGRSAP